MLRTRTLQQRLSRFGLAVVGVASLVLAIMHFVGEYVEEKEKLLDDVETVMEIATESLQPYLVFADAKGAEVQARGLLRRPDILAVRVLRNDDSVLAEVVRALPGGESRPPAPPAIRPHPHPRWLYGDSIMFASDIRHDTETVGKLELHVDLRPLWREQWLRLGWVLFSMLLALAIAMWIARRLRGAIIRPIADLDQAAREIAESGDYAVRVSRRTDDELGRLVDRFNLMLDAIAAADQKIRAQHEELERQRTFLQTLVRTMPDLVWFKDPDGVYLACNKRVEQCFGAPEAQIVGKSDFDFVSREQADFFRANDQAAIEHGVPTTNEEWVSFASDGHRECLETVKTPLFDTQGNLLGVLGIGHDITERKEHQQYLEHIAHYDTLTGLPNRALLADRLRQAMAQAQRQGHLLAVIYLDLDGFKAVNDAHGHEIGDKLLKIVAVRMGEALREGDTLARMGGDEFIAVLVGLKDQATCVPVLDRLLVAAAAPVLTDGLELHVSASVGVSFFPQSEGIDADQLLRQADEAMYEAKKAGKNRFHLFDPHHDQKIRHHYESIDAIRTALGNGEFVLYYQPKVNMRHGEVIGVEALIRWQHPQRGLVPPAQFLPLIENSSLSVNLGEWVLESALVQIERWRRTGIMLPVSVNIGAFQLQHSDFLASLRGALARHPDVQSGDLEVEVLETNALEDIEQAVGIIRACRELGGHFAIDDFGTGYSSLTYIKHLPVDLIKIDQSFIRDMLDNPGNLPIVKSILDLAQAFGRQVLAEGVETPEHGQLLLRLGCDLGQGYAIARPMPAEAIPGWLARWRPDPTWRACRVIRHEDRSVLQAMVELQAWINQLARHLENPVDARPSLDAKGCPFGRWLAREGMVKYSDQPVMARIVALHEVILLGAQALIADDADAELDAAQGLEKIRLLRNDLIDCMEQLIRSASLELPPEPASRFTRALVRQDLPAK